jgi:hypothetical protein
VDHVLYRDRDSVRLHYLRTAVRADFGRSAMIYSSPDLATWIRRSLANRGHTIDVVPDSDGNLIFTGLDAAAWAIVQRGFETTRFD